MERGSSKHSARVDDEMRHEVESLMQGASAEARVEEHLEKEGPGDDEPVPQQVLRSTTRGATGER